MSPERVGDVALLAVGLLNVLGAVVWRVRFGSWKGGR